jgi:long-subunit fatty acid transport protein
MLNTKNLMCAIPLALGSTTAFAGGMEKTALSTAFLFESGNYAELSFQSSDYDVSSSSGGDVSVIGDLQTTNFALKFDIDDKISFGISRYLQSSIDVNYPSNWVSGTQITVAPGVSIPQAQFLPSADLKIDATAALIKYRFNENFSLTGGVKLSTVRDASLSIPFTGTNVSVAGDSETSYIYGLAYERPEIALRVELIREEEVGFSLTPTGTFANETATGTEASLPTYTSLNVQSGIAPDTLAFFSARRADWASHQVILSHDATTPLTAPISNFSDTTTYSVGIGRKLSDTLSASLAYNWEEGSGPNSTSSLSITDGYRGISAGIKYTYDNITISGGVNYTQLGDTIVNQNSLAGPVLTDAPFNDNTVTSVGLRIGYHF